MEKLDIKFLISSFQVFHDSDSGIESMLVIQKGILAGKHDGTCVWYGTTDSAEENERRIVLSGADADPVYSLASSGKHVFTAARDGCIRKYCLADIF